MLSPLFDNPAPGAIGLSHKMYGIFLCLYFSFYSIYSKESEKGGKKMKWKTTDIDIYFQAKEYVDTALIPIFPIGWGEEVKTTVSLGEFIALFADELERQFKGRLVQFPPFTYLKDEVEKQTRLAEWVRQLKEAGFQHVILLTSDVDWKRYEHELNGMLVWLPVLPLEHVEAQYKQEMLASQMKQIIQLITTEWQKEK